MKKLYAFICCVMLISSAVPTQANDDKLGIAFDGDSKQFIHFEENQEIDSFKDIMPGETRTQTITLKNDNFQKMKFYVRVDEDKLLDEASNSNRIVYDLVFKNNEETFYSGRVGGTQNKGKENLKENYLLKSLNKGETTTLYMDITFNGTSMDNSYQNNIGDLGLVLGVEVDTGNEIIEIIKKIPVINKIPGVSTGDTTMLNTWLALLGGSITVIVLLVIKRKRGKNNEAS